MWRAKNAARLFRIRVSRLFFQLSPAWTSVKLNACVDKQA